MSRSMYNSLDPAGDDFINRLQEKGREELNQQLTEIRKKASHRLQSAAFRKGAPLLNNQTLMQQERLD